MLDKIIDIITAILPFFGGRKKRQQMMQDVKEFSELVKEQYGFLMKQLEKVLKDYFDLSDRVKEMHSEIFSLKGKLSEAVTLHNFLRSQTTHTVLCRSLLYTPHVCGHACSLQKERSQKRLSFFIFICLLL